MVNKKNLSLKLSNHKPNPKHKVVMSVLVCNVIEKKRMKHSYGQSTVTADEVLWMFRQNGMEMETQTEIVSRACDTLYNH